MSDDRTEREQWAEMEAIQFEKSAQYIQDCIAGWLKAGDRTSPEGFMKCAEIAWKVQFYKDAARQLRQPYYIRLEMEQSL